MYDVLVKVRRGVRCGEMLQELAYVLIEISRTEDEGFRPRRTSIKGTAELRS